MQQIKLEKIEVINLDYRQVLPLQGNLKSLSAQSEHKLLSSLKQKGKFVPEFVWLNPLDSKYYTLDGHSRLKVYIKNDIKFNGAYEIPFLQIQADSLQDAKEKLLLINSDYGKISERGMLDFIKDMNISVEWMNSSLDMSGFSDFNFIEHARKMQMNLGRDLLTMPKANIEQTPLGQNQHLISHQEEIKPNPLPSPPSPLIAPPKASDDEYQSITEIVPYSFKLFFTQLRAKVMREKGFTQLHEAFQYIVNRFNEVEYGG